jgi:hypothetical protein
VAPRRRSLRPGYSTRGSGGARRHAQPERGKLIDRRGTIARQCSRNAACLLRSVQRRIWSVRCLPSPPLDLIRESLGEGLGREKSPGRLARRCRPGSCPSAPRASKALPPPPHPRATEHVGLGPLGRHWLGAVESSTAGQQDDGPSRVAGGSHPRGSPWSAAARRPRPPPGQLPRQPTERSWASSPSPPWLVGLAGAAAAALALAHADSHWALLWVLSTASASKVRFMCWRPGAQQIQSFFPHVRPIQLMKFIFCPNQNTIRVNFVLER